MKLAFRNKTETLDIEEFEYRKDFELGEFLFGFFSIDFADFKIDKHISRKESEEIIKNFFNQTLDISETFFYLIYEQFDNSGLKKQDTPFSLDCLNKIDDFLWFFDERDDIKDIADAEFNDFVVVFNDIIERLKLAQITLLSVSEFCLDMDNVEHDFTEISIEQRWYIYNRIDVNAHPMLLFEQFDEEVTEETMIVKEGELFFSNSLFHSDNDEMEDYFDDLEDVTMDKNLMSIISKYKEVKLEKLKVYNMQGIFGVCWAECWELILNGVRIRKCGFCDRYFVPYSESAEYCTRNINGKNKSCKEYAPMYFYRERIKGNEFNQIFNKANNAHYVRHKRNPEHFTWEMLEKWREKAKEKLELAVNGEITLDEFKKVLKPNTIV